MSQRPQPLVQRRMNHSILKRTKVISQGDHSRMFAKGRDFLSRMLANKQDSNVLAPFLSRLRSHQPVPGSQNCSMLDLH